MALPTPEQLAHKPKPTPAPPPPRGAWSQVRVDEAAIEAIVRRVLAAEGRTAPTPPDQPAAHSSDCECEGCEARRLVRHVRDNHGVVGSVPIRCCSFNPKLFAATVGLCVAVAGLLGGLLCAACLD